MYSGEPYQEWLIRVPDSIIERFLDDKLSYGVICYRVLALNRDCPEIIGHDARISTLLEHLTLLMQDYLRSSKYAHVEQHIIDQMKYTKDTTWETSTLIDTIEFSIEHE
jgi:hypothetical protein